MKYIFFFILFPLPSFANQKYFIVDKLPTYISQSGNNLEFRIYKRENGNEEWKLINKGSICYSKKEPTCYRWVGNRYSTIALPEDLKLPIVHTRFIYGIGFEEPNANGSVEIEIENRVDTKTDKDGQDSEWKPAVPSLQVARSKLILKEWASVEFKETTDSSTRVDVRMVRAE